VFKSTDGGGNWTRVLIGAGVGVPGLAIDPKVPTTLCMGWLGGPMYKSLDGGRTWMAVKTINTSMPWRSIRRHPPSSMPGRFPACSRVRTAGPAGAPSTLACRWRCFRPGDRPADTCTLYAGTLDKGVFKSTDAGENWSAANTGLTPPCLRPSGWRIGLRPPDQSLERSRPAGPLSSRPLGGCIVCGSKGTGNEKILHCQTDVYKSYIFLPDNWSGIFRRMFSWIIDIVTILQNPQNDASLTKSIVGPNQMFINIIVTPLKQMSRNHQSSPQASI